MGVYLMVAGVNKIRGGIGAFVEMAAGAIPSYLPVGVGRAYLHAVPILEVVVGTMLLVGLVGRLAGLVGFLMVLSFTMAVTGVKAADGSPFHANVVFMGVMACLFLAGPGGISVDRVVGRKRRKEGK
jgi:uncharacterized membrane protein YphA (DoxX/SURF4 family)